MKTNLPTIVLTLALGMELSAGPKLTGDIDVPDQKTNSAPWFYPDSSNMVSRATWKYDDALIVPLHLTLITNWTGLNFQNKELGYIATNHVAEIVYQGETNLFTLRTDASDKAVWRANAMKSIQWMSPPNIYVYTNWITTNSGGFYQAN